MEILSKNKCTPNASASSKTKSTKVDNISQFLSNRWNAKIDELNQWTCIGRTTYKENIWKQFMTGSPLLEYETKLNC
ncbi:hypothetical protein T12_15754 [Trichinella patagoniensis]|uniref:Uncharacterized protein n=1 Tax=Trichinella patagoniensis TaxID=990121 RepID=A0A0V0Z750_9BILA|nr:hypothetical protein T12_8598 [Trichinella patagoniensis]KRY11291.1 hypothetical protein T12_3678 [Trichinella patagoniensis]KRY13252.1 hypothetical protein T12_15754 [Trichinella patagoniensis]